MPVMLLVLSFGPYVFVSWGVRVSHLALYPLAILAVPLLFRARFEKSVWWFLSVVTVPFLLTLGCAVLVVSCRGGAVSTFKLLSHFENFVQPVALVVVMSAFTLQNRDSNTEDLLRRSCQLLVMLLCLNTVVALVQMRCDISGVLVYFTGTVPYEMSVNYLASLMDRYCGIFNQPLEAGLAYTAGLFAWGYIERQRGKISLVAVFGLAGLCLGGLVTVSKIFILGGIPLFAVYWLCGRKQGLRVSRPVLIAAPFVLGTVVYLALKWPGWWFLKLLVPEEGATLGELIDRYTGHRFGMETSGVGLVFREVWQASPLVGIGLGSRATLDSGYLEFLYQAGLVGLLSYLTVLGGLVWGAYLCRREERRLLIAMAVLAMGGSIGGPVLTVNRFAVIFWVIYMLGFAKGIRVADA